MGKNDICRFENKTGKEKGLNLIFGKKIQAKNKTFSERP